MKVLFQPSIIQISLDDDNFVKAESVLTCVYDDRSKAEEYGLSILNRFDYRKDPNCTYKVLIRSVFYYVD